MSDDRKMMHFTKEGVLYHCYYVRTVINKHGAHWHKEPGSEQLCDCPNRDTDRQALLGITEA